MKELLSTKLGNTGVSVTRLGGGGHFTIGPTGHSDVARRVKEIHRQIDSGITYFDVQWEPEAAAMAEVLRTCSGGFTVAWPLHGVTKLGGQLRSEYIIDYCYEYARKFGIKRMDVLLWIALELRSETQDTVMAEVRKAAERLKQEGLCGHFGFSCHHSAEMALHAIESYDDFAVMMVPYGPLLPASGKELLRSAKSKGIGTVGMKPFGGGRGFLNKIRSGEVEIPELVKWKGSGRPFQAAIRWVLANQELDCSVPGTSSLEEIDDLVAAAKEPFGDEDKVILEAFTRAPAQCEAKPRHEDVWA
jgi:aryl-alcohol dehydrogenase-like predicted oxidoreductase